MKTYKYIIAYDIREPKRLAKIHRTIKKVAIPIQKSVFLAHLCKTELASLEATLNQIIAQKQDDIRIYKLPATISQIQMLGTAANSIALNNLLQPTSLDFSSDKKSKLKVPVQGCFVF